ncbi:MAG TPA: CBS domain-containing protein [Actinomycetota bacterium]|nr:CBS domain-containing protein [Actinomycetota bacterium]
MAVLDVSARVTGVPVVDDEGRLVRTVTEPDLLLLEEEPPVPRGRRRSFLEWFLRPARFAEVEGRAGGLHAEDVMTKEVVTVGPDTTVREAVRVLLEAGVKRLPVLDEGRRVVGIVSRGDLLGPFLRPDEELEREVREDVVSREEVERCRGW